MKSMIMTLCRFLKRNASKVEYAQNEKYNVFGIIDILRREKPENFRILPVKSENHETVIDIIKKYYLTEHILVRARKVDLSEDQAITEYLITLLKQGNSLYVTSKDGTTAGVCINFAASPVDPPNLRNYAFYRQDPNAKDFLYLTAKLQETPNLWNIFNQVKVFEVKMITILPEFRRQGLAAMLTEKSMTLAEDQRYNIVRMDCINDNDYKIAERCMLRCYLRFPLHKLRSTNAPFIQRTSEYNKDVRVYVHVTSQAGAPYAELKLSDLENMIG